MSHPVIIFDNVSKAYPFYYHVTGGIKNFLFHLPKAFKQTGNMKFEALKNVSFEVYNGECIGIIGKNGAGKSTTLGLIAGVLKPTEGKVIIRGKVSSLLELGSGFHPELTGRENIILNGVLLGHTRNEVFKKMEEIIEFSELREFIDQPIRTYSSGMVARLGFSVISSFDPEILLIDEILSVGDFNFQKKCLDRMLNFKKNNVTIVFVSHSMSDIERICEKVIWIEDHKIKMIGKPTEVVSIYTGNI